MARSSKSRTADMLDTIGELALVGGVLFLGFMVVSNMAQAQGGGGWSESPGGGTVDMGGEDFGVSNSDGWS